MPVAGVGLGPKSVQVPALGQQLGQQPGGAPVAGVGPGPQSVQVPAVVQQPGQRSGGAPVSRDPDTGQRIGSGQSSKQPVPSSSA